MERVHKPNSAEILVFDPNRRSNSNEVSQPNPQRSDFLALCASIELNSEIASNIWSRMHSLSDDEKTAIVEAYYQAADAVTKVGQQIR